MTRYTTISDDNDTLELSAIISDHGKYAMPSLLFKEDEKEIECWDNDGYLLYTIYPYLESDDRNPELDKLFLYRKKEVLSMFASAIAMGFFAETKYPQTKTN